MYGLCRWICRQGGEDISDRHMTFPSSRHSEAVAEESDKEIQGKEILRSAGASLRMTRNRVPQDGGMGGVLRMIFFILIMLKVYQKSPHL